MPDVELHPEQDGRVREGIDLVPQDGDKVRAGMVELYLISDAETLDMFTGCLIPPFRARPRFRVTAIKPVVSVVIHPWEQKDYAPFCHQIIAEMPASGNFTPPASRVLFSVTNCRINVSKESSGGLIRRL